MVRIHRVRDEGSQTGTDLLDHGPRERYRCKRKYTEVSLGTHLAPKNVSVAFAHHTSTLRRDGDVKPLSYLEAKGIIAGLLSKGLGYW